MKKYLLSFLIALVALPLLLTGCGGIHLKNAPTESIPMKVYGGALAYNDYIYFANSFFGYSDMPNEKDNAYVYRVALNTEGKNLGQIEYNEETKLPIGVEKAVTKVAGSEYSFMFSSGKYIYFSTPSTDIDSNTKDHHYEYNHYYRVNTDGTGLKKFYATSTKIEKQSVLSINGVDYLVFVDTITKTVDNEEKTINQLVAINLDSLSTKVVVEDFTSVVFADKYMSEGDKYAYFLRDVDAESNQVGSELYKVSLISGEDAVQINANQTRKITLKKLFNGKLYFELTELTGIETELNPVYVVNDYTTQNTYHPITIFEGTTANISEFDVILGENNEEYYVFSMSTPEKTYVLTRGTTELAGNELVNAKIDILFSYGDYVYYKGSADGIYRISVRGTFEPQIISNFADYKTTNISFDGTYIYYFAKNADLISGETYYMYRSQVNINTANSQLLSYVPEDELASEQTEE